MNLDIAYLVEIWFTGSTLFMLFIFLCQPQKLSVNVCFMKILKSTDTNKVILFFYNLDDENF